MGGIFDGRIADTNSDMRGANSPRGWAARIACRGKGRERPFPRQGKLKLYFNLPMPQGCPEGMPLWQAVADAKRSAIACMADRCTIALHRAAESELRRAAWHSHASVEARAGEEDKAGKRREEKGKWLVFAN